MTSTTSPTIPPSKTSPAGSPTGGPDADAPSPTPPETTTETPLRAVAYIRESTEEQGQGFSPDAQRERIREFAPENDLQLIGEYCDFHSGWRKSAARPQFQRLMADAAAGKFDVVLVFHTSRFARNQVEARRYKQMLREKLGIRVVSVTQPMGEDHSDPSSFLAESIHEMFDEYYSVSLSFWVRSGLKEKARQGHLVGQLPFGYMRDPRSKLAIPDPERAPLVLEAFERYVGGQESDVTIARWLNATGARTTRNRPFGKDGVREMLCNSAYCGYIGGKRDRSRTVKGLHEPIVSEELYERVQEVRGWRNRVLKPGPPSGEYLLSKLLRCERCGARMHATRGGSKAARRYMCSARRSGNPCGERIVNAERLEGQLVQWIRDFKPDERLIALIVKAVEADRPAVDPTKARRGELLGQLGDFESFWELETEPSERRKLLLSLFEQVWAREGQIVAVQPHEDFLPYFQAASRCRKQGNGRGAKSGSDGTRTRDLCRDRAAL
jgi:site-specific DNA recombinase